VSAVERLCRELVRWRWWTLSFVVVVTGLAWPLSQRLAFDQSIESMFAPTNARLQAFQRSRATFGGDEFLILAYSEPTLFDEAGRVSDAARDRMETLTQRLQQVEGIDPKSIQHVAAAMRTPYARQRIREFSTGVLIGADGKTTAVVSRLLPITATSRPRAETFREVRSIAAAHQPPAMVVGEPIQVHDMFRYVEEDGSTLGWAASGLLMVVILGLFRSVRWMLLPWLVVQVSLVWTKALLVVSQAQLSMVSSMLNSLVTIIGVATGMHLTLRFRELRRAQSDRIEATQQAILQLAGPTFWTIATTMVGFAALISSHIAPVASFGVMMTLATGVVLLVAALLFPGGILVGWQTAVPLTAPAEATVSRWLGDITELLQRRAAILAVSLGGLMLFCLAGLLFLQVETDFSKNFRAESPVVKALDFFETRLGGSGTWEVNFSAPSSLTDDYLTQVQGLVDDLQTLVQRTGPDRLTKVISITDGLDLIPERVLFARISLDTRVNLLNSIQPDFVEGLYNPDQGRMRIMLRALERQPADSKLALIAEVERMARTRFPDAEVAGLFVLLSFLIESLLDDQTTSTILSALGLVLLMTLATRRPLLAILLLIPNLFPIVLVLGTMGWLGLKMNIATAMIASVSLGLTIDSTIHYLWGFEAARQRGATFYEALRETHTGVGLALVFANVALVVGFSVLTLSHFMPLVYFGVLVSAAMIGGLLGNLSILPLLLRLMEPGGVRQTAAEGAQPVAVVEQTVAEGEPERVNPPADS
jgi:uncharacterized protein